jgi:uncharacterized protein YuzE
MDVYRFTEYFENEVLRKRPYLKKEWCIKIIENPIKIEPQENNRVQTMKLNYYEETASLYIDLAEKPSTDSKEVSEGIVLDYDADGNLVGIDIDNASKKVQPKELTLRTLPFETHTFAA